MALQRPLGEKVFDATNAVLMVLLCITILYPFMRQITLSLSTAEEAMKIGFKAFPRPGAMSLASYGRILQTPAIGNAYFWTVLRTALGTTLTVAVTMSMGYPLAKRYLPLRTFWTIFVLITMLFGGGIVPTFILVRSLGLVNSIWSLILPILVDPFTLIIARNYLMALPEELEESARIDGASDLTVFVRIVVPLSMPIIATVALWTMVLHWNSWFDALIYITSPKIKVLQILLRRVLLESNFSYSGLGADVQAIQRQEELVRRYTPETIKASILMVSTLPILCTYPFMQRYFVKGIILGSLKG
ncbi:MAG: carbohydrate ABC transporter permease [Spirochaetaceae bacterium]|nr:carbohydrate ABC transporter permease [Spirochaetaceae bacterium]